MRREQPQLAPSEEVVLRRVALAALRGVPTAHLQHLQHLRLIEVAGTSWRLTPLGQQRLKAMQQRAKLLTADAYEEIERILAKFGKPSGLTDIRGRP
jgi:hypothetical protein